MTALLHAELLKLRTTRTFAVVVGTAQAIALIPGASRSGTTITAGLFRGLDRAIDHDELHCHPGPL